MSKTLRVIGICCLFTFLAGNGPCDVRLPPAPPEFYVTEFSLEERTRITNGTSATFNIQVEVERAASGGEGQIDLRVQIKGETRVSPITDDIPFEFANITIPPGQSSGSVTVTLKCAPPTGAPAPFGSHTLQGTSPMGRDTGGGGRAGPVDNPLLVHAVLPDKELRSNSFDVLCVP